MGLKSAVSGLGGVAFGALFIALGLRMGEAHDEATANVRAVEAEIVSTSVERVVRHTAPDSSRVSWYPQLEYRYTVQGETYFSDAIWPASDRGGEEDWARAFIADYQAGDTVEANYQPDAPGQAYLIEGRPWLSWMAMAMGGIFALLGAARLARSVMGLGESSA